ncbi:MAG: hypothetical protein WCZ86_04880, partial [Desulfurivibrionaceae bacterium]
MNIADYPIIPYSIPPQAALVANQGFPPRTRIVQYGNLVLKVIQYLLLPNPVDLFQLPLGALKKFNAPSQVLSSRQQDWCAALAAP